MVLENISVTPVEENLGDLHFSKALNFIKEKKYDLVQEEIELAIKNETSFQAEVRIYF